MEDNIRKILENMEELDTWDLAIKTATKDLTNLINQACNQARIDELERILTAPDKKRRRYIREPSAEIVKRIKELKELNNE